MYEIISTKKFKKQLSKILKQKVKAKEELIKVIDMPPSKKTSASKIS